jgi:hypothetical protein
MIDDICRGPQGPQGSQGPQGANGSAGSLVALSDVFVVDPNTSVAPADRTGAWSAPFATINAALAAAVTAGLTEVALELVPGTYAAEALAPTVAGLSIHCLGDGLADLSACTWNQAITSGIAYVETDRIIMPRMTLTSAAPTLVVVMVACAAQNTSALSGAPAFGGVDATGLAGGSAAIVQIQNIRTTGTIVGVYALIGDQVSTGAAVNVFTPNFFDSTIGADVTWTGPTLAAEFDNCFFPSVITITGPGGGELLYMDDASLFRARQRPITFGAGFELVPLAAQGGTTAQRTALPLGASGVGFLFYDTDLAALMAWNGAAWVAV